MNPETQNQDTRTSTFTQTFSAPLTPTHHAILGAVLQAVYEAGKVDIRNLRPLLEPMVTLGVLTYSECLGLVCHCAGELADRDADIAFEAWLDENTTTEKERDSDTAGYEASEQAGAPAYWDAYRRNIEAAGYPELVQLAKADASALDLVKCRHWPQVMQTEGAQFVVRTFETAQAMKLGRSYTTVQVRDENLLGAVIR